MKHFLRLILTACTALTGLSAFALPVIDHDPISSAQPGKSLSILARVTAPGSAVKTVHLYYTPSPDASAIKVPMKSATTGNWYAVIPSRYTSGSKVYYYIHAEDSTGATTETEWSVVTLNPLATQPEEGPSESVAHSRWFWPTVVVGGGALAIGGALALSDSGGGSGDGGNTGGGDGSGGETVTVSGSDNVSSLSVSFPHDVVIDASNEINGRGISTVRIDFFYNPADDGSERFQVLYNGSVIMDTGLVLQSGRQSVTVVGGGNTVTVRTVSSIIGSGPTNANLYNWTLDAAFKLAE